MSADYPDISIIGRDRVLIEQLAKTIRDSVRRTHETTDPREDQRGSHFDVRVLDANGNRSGHVARVTVTLMSIAKVEGVAPTRES